MTEIGALFYDGRTSAPREARLRFDPDGNLRIALPTEERRYRITEIRISDRVGAAATRPIEFPDGAVAHVAPDVDVDRMLDSLNGARAAGWLRRIEGRWHYALASLALCLAAAIGFAVYGLPALARVVTDRIPASVEAKIGIEGLARLDDGWFESSKLPAERQEELRAAFQQSVAGQVEPGIPLRLEFRSSERIGANALALPGGIIVMTDDLVGLAEHDEELLAVLAHEAGHVAGRHSLQRLTQSLGMALILTALTGDMVGPGSLIAALPAVVTQAEYSRRNEREADAFAFRWADERGIDRRRLTDLLARVEAAQGGLSLPTLFSTHPSTAERERAAAEGSSRAVP